MMYKSHVFERFREYKSDSTSAFMDQSTEYSTNNQKNWYKANRMLIEATVAYSPQQNGVAELFNRTLIEKVRAMLLDSRLPKRMWFEAMLTGVTGVRR